MSGIGGPYAKGIFKEMGITDEKYFLNC